MRAVLPVALLLLSGCLNTPSTEPDPAPMTDDFRVSILHVTGYYNDAPEPFLVKLTMDGGDQEFRASANSEHDLSLSVDCTTAHAQIYVEVTDQGGHFRQGKWSPARCGASWGYFVGIDQNDAGVLSLTFLQDHGR